MSCERCKDVVERTDIPHVVRACEGCGRDLHIVEPGDHGKGMRIREGDRVVIPQAWLTLSANPLKSTGSFSRAGLRLFASHVFVEGLLLKEEDYPATARALEDAADRVLYDSSFVQPLDPNDPDDSEQIAKLLGDHQGAEEFWAFWTGQFLALAREAISNANAAQAAWATACAERCRSMMIFKQHLEEVVWMGHSAKRIIDVLRIWDSSQTQSDEEFWQITFNEHSYVLSQVFAVPVVLIQDKAYVGGMKVDRNEAKFVDYLMSAESSREAILFEIKPPTTKLLGRQYRKGVHAPSVELSGAVVQVLSYRDQLTRNIRAITGDESIDIRAFRPKCVLLVGNGDELDRNQKRESFELFRAGNEVEIVTYDELFRKVEILAELFSLKRAAK